MVNAYGFKPQKLKTEQSGMNLSLPATNVELFKKH